MKIQDRAFVEIEYKLTLDSGEEVDRSQPQKPLGFIVGAQQMISGLEKRLVGMEMGQSAKLVVDPADAYGPRNPELVRDLPRANFPDGMKIEAGMIFQARTPQGPASLRVVEVSEESVKGDFNHPLAGERLTFDVKVTGVREATREEIEASASCQPSACGSGGCSSCGG